jgi:uncharacterized membrane protein YgdD (TMEM256/DUF423 family)
MNSARFFFDLGSILAGLSVAAGAFGAHALEGRIDDRLLDVFATAARYQMSHALALLAVAWGVARWPQAGLELGGWLIASGITIFSGSLYLLALTGVGRFGAVTPIGGVLMIAGWAVLAWRVARSG